MDLKDIQESLLNFPQIFKLVWIPHCLLMSYTLRLTYGPSALSTSKKAPFSCLLRNVLYTFPGGVVSSLAMGDPIFSFLTNNFSVTIKIKVHHFKFMKILVSFFRAYQCSCVGIWCFSLPLTSLLELLLC